LKIISKIFLSLLFVYCFNFAYARETIVVTGNDYAPFTDEKLPDGGVYTSIVKKILARMKVKYSLEFLPWARGYEMVKKGKADLTFPYIITEERKNETVYAAEPLMSAKIYLVTNLKPQNEARKTVADFKGAVFCNPVGYAQEPSVQAMIEKKELTIVREFDAITCLKTVIAGQADVLTLNGEYLRKLSKEGAYNSLYRKVDLPVAINPHYVIFSKLTDPKFIAEFNKQSHEYMATEEYKKLIKPFE